MQIVSKGDNLQEMSGLFSEKNKKNISKCHLLKFVFSMQSINEFLGYMNPSSLFDFFFFSIFEYLLFHAAERSNQVCWYWPKTVSISLDKTLLSTEKVLIFFLFLD